MSDDQRELGSLLARVDHLEREVSELRQDVKALLALVENAKGRWAMFVLFGTGGGALGAWLSKSLPWMR